MNIERWSDQAVARLIVVPGVVVVLLVLCLCAPTVARAGEETSGLFVQFTGTRDPDPLPGPLSTKRMCPGRAGTHTFAPELRIDAPGRLNLVDPFLGALFDMTLRRTGGQPTLEKTARFRITRNGVRPVGGGAARINFLLVPEDCVDLVYTPVSPISLLRGEVLTASLFLTREPPPLTQKSEE